MFNHSTIPHNCFNALHFMGRKDRLMEAEASVMDDELNTTSMIEEGWGGMQVGLRRGSSAVG